MSVHTKIIMAGRYSLIFFGRALTTEQKQWPQGSVTGPSNNSPHIVQRSELSRVRSPGAFELSGKSVGSGTSVKRWAFMFAGDRWVLESGWVFPSRVVDVTESHATWLADAWRVVVFRTRHWRLLSLQLPLSDLSTKNIFENGTSSQQTPLRASDRNCVSISNRFHCFIRTCTRR